VCRIINLNRNDRYRNSGSKGKNNIKRGPRFRDMRNGDGSSKDILKSRNNSSGNLKFSNHGARRRESPRCRDNSRGGTLSRKVEARTKVSGKAEAAIEKSMEAEGKVGIDIYSFQTKGLFIKVSNPSLGG
jgi:hypothetical protein